MDKLSWGLAVDAAIALILIWKLIQGNKQGVVKKLGGLVSLVCAIFGGRFAMERFGPIVSDKWVQPFITGLLEKAKDSLGVNDLLENLGSILSGVNLPAFLKAGVLDDAAQRIVESGKTALTAASDVIASRLAAWLLFLVGAAIVFAVVKVIFDGVLDPVIRKLPLIKDINKLMGMVLGAAVGVILAGLALMLVYKLIPSLSQEAGAVFSPESVEKTYLVKLYFRFFPSVFS